MRWHVGQGNGEGSVFQDGDGRMRYENGTTLYPICSVIDFDGEGPRHAALIAAAPEMADQLRGWLAIFSRVGVFRSPLVNTAIRETEAILAKLDCVTDEDQKLPCDTAIE